MLPIDHPDIDAIYRQTACKEIRTLCVSAAHAGEGATAIALALGRRAGAAGLNTLLIDADAVRGTATERLGLTKCRWSSNGTALRAEIRHVARLALHVLPASVGGKSLSFRDQGRLRQLLDGELGAFDFIVVDAPPVLDVSASAIPAEAIAGACEAMVLVVLTGVTSEYAVRSSVERLLTTDARLCGTILNDFRAPSVADELCRRLDRFARFTPGLVIRAKAVIRRSAVLSMQVG